LSAGTQPIDARDSLELTDRLADADPYVWLANERLVNERGQEITFDRHPFLIAPLRDPAREIAVRKAAQLGFTLIYHIKTLHRVKQGLNWIYTYPTDQLLQNKVKAVCNALLRLNPALAPLVAEDEVHAKRIGDGWLWFRPTESERSPISDVADGVSHDEYDRGNLRIIGMFDSRLGGPNASAHRYKWRFSNPTSPGVETDPTQNIDGLYRASDQKHWFLKCSCGQGNYGGWQYLSWPESVDMERKVFRCVHCGRELDRTAGRWVPKYPGRAVSGYWLSQFAAPWIDAATIIEESRKDPEYFANFVLGLPYVRGQVEPFDIIIDRNLMVEPPRDRKDLLMGADQGYSGHYAVTGNWLGVHRADFCESWAALEAHIRAVSPKRLYIDLDPEREQVFRLMRLFPGKVVPVDTQDDPRRPRDLGWSEPSKADKRVLSIWRTMTVDRCVRDMTEDRMKFFLAAGDPRTREFISHWQAMVAVEEEDEATGRRVRGWERKGPDHWAWATIFWWIAMAKGGGGAGLELPKVEEEG
jgi:hypothetical protein